MKVEVIQADITTLVVDAIVNAANPSLLGGAGVDGAIHRAAGSGLLQECRTLGGCATGEAKATGGHRLPAGHVIHVVGPVWRGGRTDEPALLAACYRNALSLAAGLGARSVAFPAISTGAYGYPLRPAAGIAIDTVLAHATEPVSRVVLCCYSAADAVVYRSVLAQRRVGEPAGMIGGRSPAGTGRTDPERAE